MGRPLVFKRSGHKDLWQICLSCAVARDRQSIDQVFRNFPLGYLYVCTKCHGNPSIFEKSKSDQQCHPLSQAASMAKRNIDSIVSSFKQINHILSACFIDAIYIGWKMWVHFTEMLFPCNGIFKKETLIMWRYKKPCIQQLFHTDPHTDQNENTVPTRGWSRGFQRTASLAGSILRPTRWAGAGRGRKHPRWESGEQSGERHRSPLQPGGPPWWGDSSLGPLLGLDLTSGNLDDRDREDTRASC